MKNERLNQRTFTCIQLNTNTIEDVFPLLCPVREKDWIDGWDFKMIYSKSGHIEKDCVFSTQHHGHNDTIWQVTQYDKSNYIIEFLRITPNEYAVRINIQLQEAVNNFTKSTIVYKYTSLKNVDSEQDFEEIEKSFNKSMNIWETSLNYYLKTGRKLKTKDVTETNKIGNSTE